MYWQLRLKGQFPTWRNCRAGKHHSHPEKKIEIEPKWGFMTSWMITHGTNACAWGHLQLFGTGKVSVRGLRWAHWPWITKISLCTMNGWFSNGLWSEWDPFMSFLPMAFTYFFCIDGLLEVPWPWNFIVCLCGLKIELSISQAMLMDPLPHQRKLNSLLPYHAIKPCLRSWKPDSQGQYTRRHFTQHIHKVLSLVSGQF